MEGEVMVTYGPDVERLMTAWGGLVVQVAGEERPARTFVTGVVIEGTVLFEMARPSGRKDQYSAWGRKAVPWLILIAGGPDDPPERYRKFMAKPEDVTVCGAVGSANDGQDVQLQEVGHMTGRRTEWAKRELVKYFAEIRGNITPQSVAALRKVDR